MKADIHPTYNTKAKVTCACGNTFATGSTVDTIFVELCSECHPFYTGKQKLVDTAGRVDKFKEKMAKVEEASKGKRGKSAKRAAKNAKRQESEEAPIAKKPKAPKVKKEVKEEPKTEKTEAKEDDK